MVLVRRKNSSRRSRARARESQLFDRILENLQKSSKRKVNARFLSSPNIVSTFLFDVFKRRGKKAKEEAGDACTTGVGVENDTRAWKKGRRGGDEERWIAREARRFV